MASTHYRYIKQKYMHMHLLLRVIHINRIISFMPCQSIIVFFGLESKAEISVLSPRVAFLDHQRLVLNVDNSVLRQRIAALSQDKIFKDGNNRNFHTPSSP